MSSFKQRARREVIKRAKQRVLKQLRNNWRPSNKLRAPCFIKSLYFSVMSLKLRPKQKANQQFSNFSFLTIFYCREICKWTSTCEKLTKSQLHWASILFGEHAPNPPVILKEEWVAPSKPKFKQQLTTSFCWPSHDVTRGVYISLHLEFRSSWTSCNIWVAFRKQVSLYSCNFKATVNAMFCCVTSISIVSVKATTMLQFE